MKMPQSIMKRLIDKLEAVKTPQWSMKGLIDNLVDSEDITINYGRIDC